MRKLPFGAREIACFTTLLVTMAPTAAAVTIDSFSAPFNAVLDNLMTNYWPSVGDGDWLYDDFPCGGYDAPQASTELLYPLGLDTGNALYTERANKTIDFVIDLVEPLPELIQRIQNGEDVEEETTAAPALVHGHRYYSGSSQYDFDTSVPFILSAASYFIRQGYNFDPLNEFSGPGVIAYYQLSAAYNFRDKGLLDRVSPLVRDAYRLLELADAYWVQVDEDTGYYDAGYGPDVWNSGMVLHALSLAYQASGRDHYLDRARDLLNYQEKNWDDTAPYGYCEFPSCTVKYLSSNHNMCKGLLILYNATGDPAWLDRAHEVLVFMTDPVVIFRDDLRFPGYSIFVHDWNDYSGPSDCSCSGCNFTVLTTIYMYNRLVQEGPGGLDLLNGCNDRIDNDGDTLIDYPQDPDCDDPLDDSEASPSQTPTPTPTATPTPTPTPTPAPLPVGDLPMCKSKRGKQMTVLIPPSKMQRFLDKGLTMGECPDAMNGVVMCKAKRGKMTSVVVPHRKVQRSLAKGMTLGVCRAP
jgi:hypothetical protein